MLYVANNFCVKCNSEIYQKSDSIFRLLLISVGGVKAFPKYYCLNCGKLKYKDLHHDLRSKVFRWRIIDLMAAVVFILFLFFYNS